MKCNRAYITMISKVMRIPNTTHAVTLERLTTQHSHTFCPMAIYLGQQLMIRVVEIVEVFM
jgi:hypothetical protein